MSVSGAHAAAFYVEAAREGAVWTVRDEGGFPAPLNGSGERVQPFWSLFSRAERVVARVPAYEGFSVVEIPLLVFRERWLPGLRSDGVLIGINWSGDRATGYDLTAAVVEANLAEAARR